MFYLTYVSSTKYKIAAVCETLQDAANTLPSVKRVWCSTFVRDGATGKRYCYADLVDSWTNKPKEVQ